jgi:serine/threonine protein kinase
MMEYVDGEDLQAYVRRHKGRVPVTRRLLFNFLCSALDALSTLHGKFIAHRDVKPRNFIVTPSTSDDGTPHLTLIDLGLGVRLDERRAAPDDDAGTPAYFSPDMVAALYDDYMNSSSSNSGSSSGASRSDDDAGHGNASRSAADDDSSAAASGRVSREALYAGDLWALGASLYFLVTGDHIAPQFDWESPRLREVFDAILDFKLPKRKPGTKTVLFHDDALIDRVICTCLQADPNKRSTASELLQLLKDEYEESEDDDDDNDTDNDGADDTDDATEDVSTASRKRPLGRSTRSTSKVLDDASDDGDVADSLVVNSKPRRATRSAMGAVLLSPALERRKPSAAAAVAAPPPPQQQQQRMTTRRAQSIAAAAALAEMSPDEPKRSRRSTVILPTLTPRTLRLHNRRRVVVDDDDDDDEEEATDAKPRKGKGDKRKEDRGEAENGDDDDDDDDEAENEALVSAIEAPPTDEMELNARRSRINERLRPRTRQQTVAAAAALAASPRRTKRQRTAAAVVEGTLSDDEAERNPARRTRSSMRLRR